MKPNPITPTVDFNANGIQHGHLRLPHSHNTSAWGSILIPVCVIKNGDGPTALLTGANHGDEYEGPLALFDLANTVSPDEITGRIIIIPAMNFPAFKTASRLSPIDQANMNRVFPGRPDGSITEKIADYFTRTLIPMADYVLDIHSGGKTLDFIPFAAIHKLDDKDQQQKSQNAMQAFGAPYEVHMSEIDPLGMYDHEVERQGKVFVTTELGGAGRATPETIEIARRGVRNFLNHAGITKTPIIPPAQNPQQLEMSDEDCFTLSEKSGLIEYTVTPGDQVKRGDTVARIFPVGKTGIAPHVVTANRDGIIICIHALGLIEAGDCLVVIGTQKAAR